MTLPVPWNIWRSRNTACKTTGGPDVVCVHVSLNEYINIHMDKLMRWVVQTLACVASVSNWVITRKLERKQKKGWSSFPFPSPVIHFFFLLLSQLSRRTSRGNACYAGYVNNVRISSPGLDCEQSLICLCLACEQALCLGKNSEEREGKGGEAFPSPYPARLKACVHRLVFAKLLRVTAPENQGRESPLL